jgi:hypothetical protein
MTTERRDTPRFPFSIEAELGVRGAKPHPCRIRDVSHGGAFVETSTPPGLGGDPVDLIVHVTRDGQLHRVRYQTLVARQTDNGVGVFFCGIGAPGFIPLPDLVASRFRT